MRDKIDNTKYRVEKWLINHTPQWVKYLVSLSRSTQKETNSITVYNFSLGRYRWAYLSASWEMPHGFFINQYSIGVHFLKFRLAIKKEVVGKNEQPLYGGDSCELYRMRC